MNSSLVAKARDFLHRHWRRARHWREKLILKEEAFHLVLAGFVGVIGGLVNLLFIMRVHLVQPGDPVEFAERLPDWERVLVTTLGGLAAGLVLHWGLRFVGPQGSTNLLEVVVAGDGRLPFRIEWSKRFPPSSDRRRASIGREGGITQLAATLVVQARPDCEMAAVSAAAAGRLRRGVGHRGGLQRADHRRDFSGAHRAGQFFDEPLRAAGFFLGHRGDGFPQFFRHRAVVSNPAVSAAEPRRNSHGSCCSV